MQTNMTAQERLAEARAIIGALEALPPGEMRDLVLRLARLVEAETQSNTAEF